VSIIGLNCENKSDLRSDLQPVYSDFKNALQEKNIYGKVKIIKYFKTTFQNAESDDEAILNKIEEYTNFGEPKKVEYFNINGERRLANIIDYNKNKKYVKTVTISESNNSKIIQTVQYDSLKNTSELNIFVNDTIDQKLTSFFDKNDYIIKRVSVKENDTTEIINEYKFDDSNNILFSRQQEKGNDQSITTSLNKYDSDDNLIETIYKTEWVEMISEWEWKNGRISKQTSYTIAADLTKYTDNIAEFDILYNIINSKEFKDSKLDRELKFDYEFDQNGNWIKKKVSMKEHFINSKEFIPIYVDTREISYW
jgi:hypothetical protein